MLKNFLFYLISSAFSLLSRQNFKINLNDDVNYHRDKTLDSFKDTRPKSPHHRFSHPALCFVYG